MTERWATIVKNDEGEEVVANISQMDGVPPEIRDDQKGRVKLEKVEDGVLIGMIRGGPVDAVGGFGFPEGSEGAEGRGSGFTRNSDLRDKAGPTSNPDIKSRGNEVPKYSPAGEGIDAVPAKAKTAKAKA